MGDKMDRMQLLAYALKYNGNYNKIKQAITKNELFEKVKYDQAYFTCLDQEYPLEFNELKDPPYVVFYRGNVKLLKYKKIAIVGSRLTNDYGKAITEKIVSKLASEYVIVSGMAKGIDCIAHVTANHIGSSIGVLGCGIDRIYPLSNTNLYYQMYDEQLLISEYPGMTAPLKQYFPFRNRLIAALGQCLIVTQAGMRSGTMLTVNEALELNRDIYVVPHPLSDIESGCNYLIKQGANVITCIDDLNNI